MYYFFLFFIIQFLVTFCIPVVLSSDETGSYDKEFYDACAQGNMDKVTHYVDIDPNWAKKPTPDGETCLHLTAISKSFGVSQKMIDLNADVNSRTTHSRGLRMTPLAWHVYAGNLDIVRLLLDNGADINLEFDLDESGKKGTVMNVSTMLNKSKDPQNNKDDPFVKVHELLIERGGKTYE